MARKPFASLENILPAGYSNEIEVNVYDLTYESSPSNKDNYNLTYESSPPDNMDNYDLTYKSSPDKDTYSLTNKSSLNKSAYDLTNESLDIENETIRGPKDITKDNSTSTSSHQLGYLPQVHVELYNEKTFETWKECQKTLEHYAKQNNFVLKKKRVDNSHNLHQRTWDCEHSGKYISHKTAPPEKQRNKGLKRINCPFLINASKSKRSDNETIIKLMSMRLEHNHPLVPENAIFATQYQKLTVEIKDLIESYTLCDLDVSSQVRLLHELFPKATIVDYDVKNYVYKFCRIHEMQDGDAAKLLQHLEKKQQFTGWFSAWHEKTLSYETPNICRRLFPNIYNILQKYVTPKILQLHVDQMNEAVMYNCRKITFEDLYNLALDSEIDRSLVAEVWEVQSIEHKSRKLQEYSNSTSNSLNIPSFSTVAESWNTMFIEPSEQTAAKVIGQKQLTKGTLLGLARKCVELVNYNDSNDSDSLMKMFKEWIYKHEEIQCNKEINMPPNTRHDEVSEYEQVTEDDQNLEQELVMKEDQFIERNQILENTQVYETTYLDVQNLLRHIGKG
ncbi:1689_t:CDS:2 [Cetraspora pellucida]|uniref:1689_t:CDS:1 n=1 Tax=Cetraspora pellucida TaxID=1433469 RepID=A0ACA9MSM7_9GLOM|nr:1689_t:CDS:2 [Cetraspora pellucida]